MKVNLQLEFDVAEQKNILEIIASLLSKDDLKSIQDAVQGEQIVTPEPTPETDIEEIDDELSNVTSSSSEESTSENGKERATPIKNFYAPLYEVLLITPNYEMKRRELTDKVQDIMKSLFTKRDIELSPGGIQYWKQNLGTAKDQLMKHGFFCKPEDCGHGTWRLTAKGISEAKRVVEESKKVIDEPN